MTSGPALHRQKQSFGESESLCNEQIRRIAKVAGGAGQAGT